MSFVTLTEEQLHVLSNANGREVEARDSTGRSVGYLEFTSEADIIAECKRRRASNRPRISWQKVQEHLQVLQEEADKGADDDSLWKLFKKLQMEAQAQCNNTQ